MTWKRDKETGCYYSNTGAQVRQDHMGYWTVYEKNAKGYYAGEGVTAARTRKKAQEAYEAGKTGWVR
jgi:hypothetical protein